MSRRGLFATGILVGLICILLVFSQYPAQAQGSSGSSGGGGASSGGASTGGASTGGASSGSQSGGQSMAGGGGRTGFTGTTAGQSPLSSSISHPERGGGVGDISFGPQGISSSPGYPADMAQQRIYENTEATPLQYGTQGNPSGYGSMYNTGYGGGYGASIVQSPGPAPAASGPSTQAQSEPASGNSCISTCTESYTPYECNMLYCPTDDKKQA